MKSEFIEANPERMSGAPCFKGTRVPVTHLIDYLEAGDSLGDFLNDFPPSPVNKPLASSN